MSKKKSETQPKEKKSAAKKAVSKSKTSIGQAAPTAVPVEEKPPKRSAPAKKSGSAKPVAAAATTEDIGLRAYFIAERRHKMGWPGDSTSDWVEAERQLTAEAKKKK